MMLSLDIGDTALLPTIITRMAARLREANVRRPNNRMLRDLDESMGTSCPEL
jgi:hypothetical protein